MAVDKENEKQVHDRLVFIDKSIDGMEGLESTQENVFKSLERMLIKELDLDQNGNIKRSRKNQKSMQKMSKIKSIVLSDGYKSMVGKFIASFNTVKSMSDKQITDA